MSTVVFALALTNPKSLLLILHFGSPSFQNTINELEDRKDISIERASESKEKELYYKELNKIFGEDGYHIRQPVYNTCPSGSGTG